MTPAQLDARNLLLSAKAKARNKKHPPQRTPCPKCGRAIVTHALPRHMRGVDCLTKWCVTEGIAWNGIAKPVANNPNGAGRNFHQGTLTNGTPKWLSLLAAYCPLYRLHAAVRRAVDDPDFAGAVEATARLGGREIAVALLVETVTERTKRLARERSDKEEREVRRNHGYLLKQQAKLAKEIKRSATRVRYYDNKLAERQAREMIDAAQTPEV